MRGVSKIATRPGALDFSGSGASSTRAERPLIKVAAIRGGLKYLFNQLVDSPKIAPNNGFAIRGRPK
jgi:hypothetical protein